jgi:hypothetical protein
MRGGFWASLALLSFLLGLLLVAFFKKEEELAQKNREGSTTTPLDVFLLSPRLW